MPRPSARQVPRQTQLASSGARREFDIARLGPLGDGIRAGDGAPVYIDRVLPGERVEARLRDGGDGGAQRAELLRVLAPSPDRVPPPCPHYDVCGGCTLQHARDEFTRAWKIDVARNAFERQGVTPAAWGEPVFLPPGQRRRVTFAARKSGNAVTLGYFARRSHALSAVSTCPAIDPAIDALRQRLPGALVPILKEGKDAEIFIQLSGGALDLAITGAVGKKGEPDLHVLEAFAAMAHALDIARVAWRVRARDAFEIMLERSPVTARFGALTVALPPLAFLQPTAAGEAALAGAVMSLLPQRGKFADLFAGCGTFSGPMLARGNVDAFEADDAAVRALAKAGGTLPLTATRRDLFRNPLPAGEASRYDAIVFDPPRAGAAEQARALAHSKTPLIIGVSCNPITFARDARILVDGGYALETVRVVDQFAWSHHVELVGAFIRTRNG